MPKDLESENRQLRQVIQELRKSNQALLERVQKLERQLKTNSRNSFQAPEFRPKG